MPDERWIKVAQLSDLRHDRGTVVRLDGTRVALFLVEGRLHALQDACPHMGTSLAEGRIHSDRVTCRWHGWSFSLEDGTGSDGARPWACARVYRVEARGADVYIERPEEPRLAEPRPDDEWIPWDDTFLKSKRGEDS